MLTRVSGRKWGASEEAPSCALLKWFMLKGENPNMDGAAVPPRVTTPRPEAPFGRGRSFVQDEQ